MILISQTLMSLAYICFLTCVIPNYIALWKQKNDLNGFSRYGVFMTALGLTGTQTALILDGVYIAAAIGMANLSYWIVLTYFVFKSKTNDKIKNDR